MSTKGAELAALLEIGQAVGEGGEFEDAGPEGIRVSTAVAVDPGRQLTIRVALPNEGESVALSGRVLRCEPRAWHPHWRYRVAMRFDSGSTERIEALMGAALVGHAVVGDRRVAARFNVRAPLSLHLPAGLPVPGESIDLSSSGVLLRSELDLAPGIAVRVRFELPNATGGVRVVAGSVARCVRRAAGDFELAIDFQQEQAQLPSLVLVEHGPRVER